PRPRFAGCAAARDDDRREARRAHSRGRRGTGHLQERSRDRGPRRKGTQRVSDRASDPLSVTGLGLVTPLGPNAEATWSRLVKGERAIRPVTLFDAAGQRASFAAEERDVDLPAGPRDV